MLLLFYWKYLLWKASRGEALAVNILGENVFRRIEDISFDQSKAAKISENIFLI